MPAFFLALIAAALATAAGREGVRVARLSHALGAPVGLLAALWLAAMASSAAAGWLGATLASDLPGPARTMLVALALLAAAVEIVVLRPRPAPSEPTRSFAAILIVLVSALLTDAARMLVLALAAALAGPWLAATGGALGSGVVLTAAWAMGSRWETVLPLSALRWGAAIAMLAAGALVALTARGLLG